VNVVLYTHELEPITVFSLDPRACERLRQGGTWNIPVFRPLPLAPLRDAALIINQPMPIVRITAQPLRKGEYETLMLFTHDEESALLLRSNLLPGQRNERQREDWLRGFSAGFLHALNISEEP
jgi:hypothetical protein